LTSRGGNPAPTMSSAVFS